MPIVVNGVGFIAPAQAALTGLMNNFNIPAPDQGRFAIALHAGISNWGAVNLDTAAAPGNAVQGGGTITYTNAAGMSRSYPVSWAVNVTNWILHTSCNVVVVNIW